MKVTIYSKQNCTYCSKAKAMMNSLGIEYTEKKLEEKPGPGEYAG